MPQAAFAHDGPSAPTNTPAGEGPSLSIYADRPHLRGEMREDAEAAGYRIGEYGELGALIDGPARALGDVVLIDCPALDGARIAALAELDGKAAQSGAQLIVSTSVTALDDVFACMDQSAPRILVDPNRGERMLALGEALARSSHSQVRELSGEDRLVMLRLTEQVGQIAQRLDKLSSSPTMSSAPRSDGAFAFDGAETQAIEASSHGSEQATRKARPALPDPKLVRKIIRQRQLRGRFLDPELFADPAWDMLLDLTAATAEHVRVSVTSLCIASGVPPTTALRWIGQMTESGLLCRVGDQTDRRRAFMVLSDRSTDAMAAFFAEVGQNAAAAI